MNPAASAPTGVTSLTRVRLDQVSRVYGRSFALHRVTTEFEAGTATALVGENGAGKTTLLNILATLDRPSSGTLMYDDLGFDEFARRHRRNIGWVSHDSLLYEDLTGAENLQFYAAMYGAPDPNGLAHGWLERVGLTEFADRRTSAYSRGMRQRLSVARALLHSPDLLLLDEPLTGLDQGGRDRLMALFSEIRDAGAIVVLITHDLHLTSEFVDRVAVLKRGKLTYHGAADVLDAFVEHA